MVVIRNVKAEFTTIFISRTRCTFCSRHSKGTSVFTSGQVAFDIT